MKPKRLRTRDLLQGWHNYVQIILDKQPSTKILKGIDRIVAKNPSLKNELHALEYQLR
jgi:hypothetical protein